MHDVKAIPDTRGRLTGKTTVEDIRAWLITEAAELFSVAPETLNPQEPLVNYGLASITGMMLAGDAEEWLGLKLDPVMIWEYPTIEALAHYLSQEVRNQETAR
jgi:phthiocerol/phenolphthiocerol synthesis type-I polyketide synthase C